MLELEKYFKLASSSGPVEWGVNRFPDGQHQFWMIDPKEPITLKAALPNPESLDLFLQMIFSARFSRIQVNYLYGARSDKFTAGDRIVCNVAKLVLDAINALAGEHMVEIISPHCEGYFGAHCRPVFVLPPEFATNEPGFDLVLFPDESAGNRFPAPVEGVREMACSKQRDQISGKVICHEIPEIGAAKQIVLIDDLCDGGWTFLSIAEALKKRGYEGTLDLSVTHGVFSNGAVPKLLAAFDRIWVSNSLPGIDELRSDRIRVLDVWDKASTHSRA